MQPCMCACVCVCVCVFTFSYSSSQHTDYVYGISWHPSKPCLLSCGWDSQLLLHHVTTDKPSAGIVAAF